MQADSGSVLVNGIFNLVGQDPQGALCPLPCRLCTHVASKHTAEMTFCLNVLDMQLVKSVCE